MYKYKQTTDVEIGDLVIWTNPANCSRRIANKPYKVIDTSGTHVAIQDEIGSIICYGSTSRKTLETKPADQAVVGDYMYRISSGPIAFPQHSVIKITKIGTKDLYYTSTRSVWHHEVIVIAQADPEVKYPLFKQWQKELLKFDGLTSGIQLTTSEFFTPGEYKTTWTAHTDPRWKPCDFTIEPEIFDLDWWQARYEEGLDVYVRDGSGPICQCIALSPKDWGKDFTFGMTYSSLIQKVPMSKEDIELFKQQVPLSSLHLGLCQEISLGAAADCSLPYPIIQKEKPMKFQDFINSLFTEEIKTDYEKKPNFLVTIYNSEGTEIAVTTATSVKSVEDTLQATPKLWGSKAVMYSIDSEVQVSVPVVTTKFKKPKEEK